MESLLSFENVTFGYSRNLVFDEFSHEFSEFPVALLGPNGAGKSTLIKLAAGTKVARRGRVQISGEGSDTPAGRRHMRRSVSTVPQSPTGMRGLTVRELVAYTAWLKGMGRRDAWREAGDALDLVNLGAKADRPSIAMSGGEVRRAAIASALCSHPELILLDEATVGIDPIERESVIDVISNVVSRTSVLFSTHEVDDLQSFAKAVVVIDHGRVTFSDTVDMFYKLGGGDGSVRDVAARAYRAALARGEREA